ncbi:MAG TPA: hypothetical protein VL049_27805, partial [Candidatus Dormibacteraeota bacterium]|nr:hypothetical protein [Candidatus Dormibacteraeota bacterium]
MRRPPGTSERRVASGKSTISASMTGKQLGMQRERVASALATWTVTLLALTAMARPADRLVFFPTRELDGGTPAVYGL